MSKLETLEYALCDEQRELKEMEELCRIAEKERDEMKVHYLHCIYGNKARPAITEYVTIATCCVQAKHAEVDKQLNEEKEAAEEDLARAQTLQDELNKVRGQGQDNYTHVLATRIAVLLSSCYIGTTARHSQA
jgi:hypothetical protein